MTYKRILVTIDDTAASERRVAAACEIACRFDARVVGLYLAPPGPFDVDRAELPPREIAARISEDALRDRVQSAFCDCAAARGRGDVEVRVVEGDVVAQAIAEMRCVDLSVLSQSEAASGGAGFERRVAEQAILANGGPILFMPYAMATPTFRAERIVVAWDGGREAARSVRDALPLLKLAREVTVLSLGAHARLEQDARRSQERLAAYLRAHGIAPELRALACTGAEAPELLLSQLADLAADVVVMGGYGHARVREIVLGGVTRTLLDSMTVPALMSH